MVPGNELQSAFLHCSGAPTGVAVFSGVVNLLGLSGSLYMLQIYDQVLPSQSVPPLVGITVVMVWLYAIYGLLDSCGSGCWSEQETSSTGGSTARLSRLRSWCS